MLGYIGATACIVHVSDGGGKICTSMHLCGRKFLCVHVLGDCNFLLLEGDEVGEKQHEKQEEKNVICPKNSE